MSPEAKNCKPVYESGRKVSRLEYTTTRSVILRAARNESGERSGVSPPVLRFCTGKLTHAARQFSHSLPRGVLCDGTANAPQRPRYPPEIPVTADCEPGVEVF